MEFEEILFSSEGVAARLLAAGLFYQAGVDQWVDEVHRALAGDPISQVLVELLVKPLVKSLIRSVAEDLVQAFEDGVEFGVGGLAELSAEAFVGEDADLADLHPGPFWQH